MRSMMAAVSDSRVALSKRRNWTGARDDAGAAVEDPPAGVAVRIAAAGFASAAAGVAELRSSRCLRPARALSSLTIGVASVSAGTLGALAGALLPATLRVNDTALARRSSCVGKQCGKRIVDPTDEVGYRAEVARLTAAVPNARCPIPLSRARKNSPTSASRNW